MAGEPGEATSPAEMLGRMLSKLMGAADVVEPHRLIELISECAGILGGSAAVVWLVDHQYRVLVRLDGADSRESVPVDGSVPGRAYARGDVVPVEADDGTHLWVPLLSGVHRVGVLEVVMPHGTADVGVLCDFAAVATAALVAANQYTDLFTRTRRQKPLSLAAELQWAALPPASFATRSVHVAGMLEPAYDVGGDAFDYAHSDGLLSFAIFDAVGHNLDSSVTSSLALGAYRNARRNDLSLGESATTIDRVIKEQLGGGYFVTGQLAVLDTATGVLSWLNAGHPLPLLIRRGRVLGHLECRPRPPFGLDHLGGGAEVQVAAEHLEPGDGVLFYSDGVVEHRTRGGLDYGVDRVKDFLHNAFAAQLSPAETLRRLANAILDFHDGQLSDDATTLLVVWQHDE